MGILRFTCAIAAIVIIPFLLWGQAVTDFSTQMLAAQPCCSRVARIVVLLLALDVLLPIPSSLVSVAAGSTLGVVAGTMAIWAGMSLGSLLGYCVGRFARVFAMRYVLRGSDVAKLKEWYARSGVSAVAATRAIPVLAESVTVTAGLLEAPFFTFAAVSASANLAIAAAYALAGAWAANADSLAAYVAALLKIPLFAHAVRSLVARYRSKGSRTDL